MVLYKSYSTKQLECYNSHTKSSLKNLHSLDAQLMVIVLQQDKLHCIVHPPKLITTAASKDSARSTAIADLYIYVWYSIVSLFRLNHIIASTEK